MSLELITVQSFVIVLLAFCVISFDDYGKNYCALRKVNSNLKVLNFHQKTEIPV